MKLEIEYFEYIIYCSAGLYFVHGFKTGFTTLREAKQFIDVIEEESYYQQ